MTSDYRPRAYIGFKCTGSNKETQTRDESLSIEIARVSKDCGFIAHWPLGNSYPRESELHPSGVLYGTEREYLLNSELLIALETDGSSGLGRLEELAEQQLIPVVTVQLKGCPLSRMAVGFARSRPRPIIVDSVDDVRAKLTPVLEELKPILQYRRSTWPERHMPPACSKNIRRIRSEKGMSQQTLEKVLGLPRNYIQDVEEGRIIPGLFALRVIAQGLGLPSAAPLLGHTHLPSTKGASERVVLDFFVSRSLSIRDYFEFCEAYEDQLTADTIPTENDLCAMFREIFGFEPI